ncbi:MAG: TIGR04282 family arsenosugar biosynthesis glycosyltransferase [Chitinophagaceae bacterium]
MNQNEVVIIFTKNPVYGKVKTRLAAGIGADKALEIYHELVACTHSSIKELTCDKIVYYSDNIQHNDLWDEGFEKAVQQGADLGERMHNAFKNVFDLGYKRAVIIGTDCPSLNAQLVMQAFDKLNTQDVIIGPAADGGYYLLGMKTNHDLFKNIAWSTAGVLDSTIEICKQLELNYYLLPVLNDIDEEKDLAHMKRYS